jgi:hypothetical protein
VPDVTRDSAPNRSTGTWASPIAPVAIATSNLSLGLLPPISGEGPSGVIRLFELSTRAASNEPLVALSVDPVAFSRAFLVRTSGRFFLRHSHNWGVDATLTPTGVCSAVLDSTNGFASEIRFCRAHALAADLQRPDHFEIVDRHGHSIWLGTICTVIGRVPLEIPLLVATLRRGLRQSRTPAVGHLNDALYVRRTSARVPHAASNAALQIRDGASAGTRDRRFGDLPVSVISVRP